MKSNVFKTNGFTLIELMIVVSIIGILASIAVPSYQNYIAQAQVAEALTITEEIKGMVEDHRKQTGEFPEHNEAAAVPAPDKLLGNHVTSVEVADGALHITLGAKATSTLRDKVLTLRPIVVPDSPASPMSWTCGHSPAPDGMEAVGENRTSVPRSFLPGSCR